ncbi:hypothetical protein [Methanobacterium formicicum]|uniref:Uncharacterized protein n=1 Tax=Methanobacterium formicicum TaxID=2162 RepID=A0A0S4FPU6_METFO|nr:hypothetical protein [Methanobacterium formicicum]CEL25110.1 hypothetical protein MB9_1474 [Methanobacterium formicicum]
MAVEYPVEFNFSYEIPGRGYLFSLTWEGECLFLRELAPWQEQQKEISPELDEWDEFWHRMDEIGLWAWYDEYMVSCDEACLEGDEWEINLVHGDMMVESHGANSYPTTFHQFLKATEELTGIIIEFIQQD